MKTTAPEITVEQLVEAWQKLLENPRKFEMTRGGLALRIPIAQRLSFDPLEMPTDSSPIPLFETVGFKPVRFDFEGEGSFSAWQVENVSTAVLGRASFQFPLVTRVETYGGVALADHSGRWEMLIGAPVYDSLWTRVAIGLGHRL